MLKHYFPFFTSHPSFPLFSSPAFRRSLVVRRRWYSIKGAESLRYTHKGWGGVESPPPDTLMGCQDIEFTPSPFFHISPTFFCLILIFILPNGFQRFQFFNVSLSHTPSDTCHSLVCRRASVALMWQTCASSHSTTQPHETKLSM